MSGASFRRIPSETLLYSSRDSEASPGLLFLLVTKENNICYFGKSKEIISLSKQVIHERRFGLRGNTGGRFGIHYGIRVVCIQVGRLWL
jgi:hypothetical protein